MLGSLAPARRLVLIAAGVVVIVVVMGMIAWIPHHGATKPVSQATAGPVLLVPS
ncbi:MAG: hypothetical protein QOE97_602 [Pseudonocardiales bacterium]|jgi:uncharacterized membrane protein|nr:hypothetical protein [Pseudonocardiales bacterium]